jgi:uncharacterized protein YjbJ (UPF0337 family)
MGEAINSSKEQFKGKVKDDCGLLIADCRLPIADC